MGLNIFLIVILLNSNYARSQVEPGAAKLAAFEYPDDDEVYYNQLHPDEVAQSDISEKKITFNLHQNETIESQMFGFPDKSAMLIASNCSLMLIAGKDLYAFGVSEDRNGADFQEIGVLSDVDDRIVDVQFISINQFNLLLVAVETRYQVYVTTKTKSTEPIRAIEKIALIGQHQRSLLFSQGQAVYALIGNGVPSELGASSTIRIFKWRQSHFTLLSQHNIDWMQDVHLCNNDDDGSTVFVVVQTEPGSDSMTLLEVFLFVRDQWRHVQNLHVSSEKIYTYSMDNFCYLITAPSQNGSPADKYVWDVDNFRPVAAGHQSVTFDHLVSNNFDLVLTLYRNTLTAFPEADFKQGFTVLSNRFVDSNEMVLIESYGELLAGFVRVYRNDSHTEYHIDLVGVRVEQVNTSTGEVGSAAPVRNFGSCYEDLEKTIEDRKTIIDNIRVSTENMMRKDQALNSSAKFNTKFASMTSGTFFKIQTDVSSVTITPSKLLKQIQDLQARLNNLKALRSARSKRDSNRSDPPPHWKSVVVKRLRINNDTTFNTMMRRTKRIHVKVPVVTNKLNAKSIQLIQSNENVRSKNGETDGIIRRQTSEIKRVNHLRVKQVNGIDWDTFVNSIYLKNAPKPLKGTLIVTKPSHVDELSVGTLNGLQADTFFTLNTDQVVEATVQLGRFLSVGINANLTNGISFSNDVVTVHGDKTIETPVIIQNCSVDMLSLSDGEDGDLSRHVVGTQLEDLSQIYTGKVIIRGSVRMNNVIIDRPQKMPSVNVNDRMFELDIQSRYWTKSTDQTFGSVRFETPFFTPQVGTDSINQRPIDEYLRRNQNPLQEVNLIFHSAAILGNIYSDPALLTTIAAISESCVRRSDTAIIQNGRKLFTGSLITDILYTGAGPNNYAELNGLLRDQLVGQRSKIVFPCNKQFQHLTVVGKVHVASESLSVSVMNGQDLIGGIKNMARITQPITLEEVVFAGNVNTGIFAVDSVQGTSFSGVLDQLESVAGDRGSIGSVHIAGDVTFQGNLQIRTINEISIDSYLSNIVTKASTSEYSISGVKRFASDIHVGSLEVQYVNQWNIGGWIENTLHRNRPQTIPTPWTISSVQTQQIWSPTINDVMLEHLIDSGMPSVEIDSDIAVDVFHVDLNVAASQTNCDMPAVWSTITNGIKKSYWKFIDVDGAVTWPRDDLRTPINRLFAYAVVDSADQIITGETTFVQPTNIHEIFTTTINDVDLVRLANDALLISNGFQAISGKKIFRNHLMTGPITAQQGLYASIYNGCDLFALNKTIFRAGTDSVMTGTKVFRVAPSIFNIQIEGSVKGVYVADLVSLNATSNTFPPAVFLADMIVDENLFIVDTLNYIPFDYFMQNRLRIYGPAQEIQGTISFQHLIIKGDARLVSINGIPIEDVVISSTDVEQEIRGRKTIIGTLYLEGPALATNVNGIDLVQAFINTVRLDRNMNIERLDVSNNITVNKGIVVQNTLHGVDVMSVLYGQPPTAEDLQPIQREILKEINQVEKALQQSQSNTSDVYLDYAADVKVKYAKQPSSELFNVDTTVPCDQCQCPVQNSVSVMQFQVNVFRQPLFQRVINLKSHYANITLYTKFEQTNTKCIIALPDNATAALQLNSFIKWIDFEGLPRTTIVSEFDSIRDAKLFEQETPQKTSLLLINQPNRTVDVLRMDFNQNDWIRMAPLAGGRAIDQMYVLSWASYNILLVTTGPTEGSVHGTAQMYYFDGHAFNQLYGTISGDYDQCASVYLEHSNEFMIWLARTGSDVVKVFKAVNHGGILRKFELLQSIIVQDGAVKTLVSIVVQDTSYMVVVTQNSFLCMYKFNYLEGWIRSTFGYFKHIETVVPFQYNQRYYLYVSMKMAATALVIHQSG